MKISDMDEDDIKRLYDSIIDVLNFSREKGTFAYEKDFFGKNGGYTTDYFPSIKTGSTTAFICPSCQKI